MDALGIIAIVLAIIVADIKPEDTALKAMIDSFIARFPYECDLI